MASAQGANVHGRELRIPRNGDQTGEPLVSSAPGGFNQAHRLPFGPLLPTGARGAVTNAARRILLAEQAPRRVLTALMAGERHNHAALVTR
jgi:hypothetical protein